MKLTSIGTSSYLIVPHEYVKVFKLSNYDYEIKVSKDGETITYKRASDSE